MVAIDWEAHAREVAVRKSSLSAASCALPLGLMYVDEEFCVRRRTCMADEKRKAMSPQKAASMRSRMVAWMESPCR